MALFALAVMFAATGCDSCEKESESVAAPLPEPGSAASEVLATEIGNGIALHNSLAPTDAKWGKVFVYGDESAVIVGKTLNDAISLRTTDGGRTWSSLRAKAGQWTEWGVGADGSVILATGTRVKQKPPPGRSAAVDNGSFWFAASSAKELRGPSQLFGAELHAGYQLSEGFSAPVVLNSQTGSLVIDRGRSPMIAYGTPAGQKQHDLVSPPSGNVVRAPYGRPAQMLTVSGGIEVRPWPKAGAKADIAVRIPNYSAGRNALNQLNRGPGCEFGNWSFQRVADSPSSAHLIGVSDTRSFSIKLPKGDEQRIGCSDQAVVVETVRPLEKKANVPGIAKPPPIPTLVRCSFDGKCAEPTGQPFELWNEKHERVIRAVPTATGLVAVMTARTPNRWGVYVGQSTNGGKSFELPRTVGEGTTDRGSYEVGAVVRLKKRVLILVSGDVGGTTRRGWFVLASDNDGNLWGPP